MVPAVLNSKGKRMNIRNHLKMPTIINGKTILATLFLANVLSACERAETKVFTADRVKVVEEKQKADANAHLQTRLGATAVSEPAAAFPVIVQTAPQQTAAKM